MFEIKTHKKINQNFSGFPLELKEGYSKLQLRMTKEMILDDTGLIHGGFLFSLADYTAMLAINHPNVVLGGANVRFILPAKLEDILIAEGHLKEIKDKKHIVEVIIRRDQELLFRGDFYCFIPQKHVLSVE
jgi:acyl-coenzyme A thioesterase PaaI-like protein